MLQYALPGTFYKAYRKVPWQCCHILDKVTLHEARKTLAWQPYNMVEKDKKKFELSDSGLQLRVEIFLEQAKLYVIALEAG